MGKKNKKENELDPSEAKSLWDGFDDEDFIEEPNVGEADLGEYNEEHMTIYSANVNFQRQIPRLSDSLKPVERRALYSMYLLKAFPKDKPKKCMEIVSETAKWHPHGDSTIYKTLVGMAQYWKKGVPLVMGKGNFGNIATPDDYAQMRYTEAKLSEYSAECFFDDFNMQCIKTRPSATMSEPEPIELPSKFPNILINGGVGIAFGNSFRIPTYNVSEIVDLCKRLIRNPVDPNIYIYPDLPTGCDIVDDGREMRTICETGCGVLRMRAKIDIGEEGPWWVLHVRTIPWLTSLENIDDSIVRASRAGALPIRDRQNASYPYKDTDGVVKMRIDLRLLVPKTQDPVAVRAALYRSTDLEKSVSIQFNTVVDGLSLETLNMRGLVLAWVDSRRVYKRKLFNIRLLEIGARVSTLKILIELLSEKNIEKVVSIIKNNNSADTEKALVNDYHMSSFQAIQIANMKLNAFTKDARDRYIAEKEKLEKAEEEIKDIIKSEKKIDEILLDELNALKKYASPRKSRIITVDNEEVISDSEHILVISKGALIKKLPISSRGYGTFDAGDYPVIRIRISNMDSVMLFDSFGRYSIIPVYSIKNTEYSNPGEKIYESSRLEGEIVCAYQYLHSEVLDTVSTLNEKVNLVCITRGGLIKKTPIEDITSTKTIKNAKCIKLKEDDSLVFARAIFDSSNLLIYTKLGKFVYLKCADIIDSGRDAQGNQAIVLEDGDECIGCCVVSDNSTYIVILTEKGYMKKCETAYLGETRKRKDSSYLTALSKGDNVFMCEPVNDKSKVAVCKRTEFVELTLEQIPTLSRRSVPVKLVPVPVGDNIITMQII